MAKFKVVIRETIDYVFAFDLDENSAVSLHDQIKSKSDYDHLNGFISDKVIMSTVETIEPLKTMDLTLLDEFDTIRQ